MLLFLHTSAINEASLWISELPKFEHILLIFSF